MHRHTPVIITAVAILAITAPLVAATPTDHASPAQAPAQAQGPADHAANPSPGTGREHAGPPDHAQHARGGHPAEAPANAEEVEGGSSADAPTHVPPGPQERTPGDTKPSEPSPNEDGPDPAADEVPWNGPTERASILPSAADRSPSTEEAGTAPLVPDPLMPPVLLLLGVAAFLVGRKLPWPRSDPSDPIPPTRDAGAPATSGPVPENTTAGTGTAEEPAPLPTPEEVPGGVPGLLLLGREATDRGDLENAERWFDTAIALDPQAAQAHTCLGVVLLGDDRPEEAVDPLRNALELDPGDVVARYHLAKALARTPRPSRALVHLEHLVGADPEVAAALQEDPDLEALHDHPRFLALVGDL